MDEWMDRWMNGWMDGYMNEWMDGWMYGWIPWLRIFCNYVLWNGQTPAHHVVGKASGRPIRALCDAPNIMVLWGWEHSMALSSRVSRFNYHLHIPPICFQILMNSFYICKSCVWTNPFMLKRKFSFLILMISHIGIWTYEPLFGILFQHMKLKRIYKCNINVHFLKNWRKLLRRSCNEKNLILLVIF